MSLKPQTPEEIPAQTVAVAQAANPVTTLYNPWGGRKRRFRVRSQSGTLPTQYTYTGQYSHTTDFGLMYYNARWYDPVLGRFAQADTIVPGAGKPLAYDRYAYTLNNPLRYTDPSGHFTEDEIKNYFGYGKRGDCNASLGVSLCKIIYDTTITWGDYLIWNSGKNKAMFVLLGSEGQTGITYQAALWGGGRRVNFDEVKDQPDLVGFGYRDDGNHAFVPGNDAFKRR